MITFVRAIPNRVADAIDLLRLMTDRQYKIPIPSSFYQPPPHLHLIIITMVSRHRILSPQTNKVS